MYGKTYAIEIMFAFGPKRSVRNHIFTCFGCHYYRNNVINGHPDNLAKYVKRPNFGYIATFIKYITVMIKREKTCFVMISC